MGLRGMPDGGAKPKGLVPPLPFAAVERVQGIDVSVAIDTCARTPVEAADLSQSVLPFPTQELRSRFFLGREIGRGSYGVVRECFEKKSGQTFACKVIQKKHLGTLQDRLVVAREVGLMQMVRGHASIVNLEGVFEDDDNVALVMELCNGGELYQQILSHGRFPEAEAAAIFVQMVDAIAFCHSKGLVHRDLKPENILFHHRLIPSGTDASETLTLEVKLADFGLGVVLAPGEFAQARIGSLMYEAPEVVCGNPYDAKADVWSLGVILHALLSGTLPFIDADQQRLARKICAGAYELRFSPWPFISVEAKALIRKLIVVDPRKRPNAAEILRDPWLAQFLEPSSPAAARLSPSSSRSLSPALAPGTPTAVPPSRHSDQSTGSDTGRVGSTRDGDCAAEEQSKCREEVPEELQALGGGAESSSHESEGRGESPKSATLSRASTFFGSSFSGRLESASPRRTPRPATAERRRKPRASMCCPFPELQLDASSLLACFFRPQADKGEDAEEPHSKAGAEKRQLLAQASMDVLQDQEQEPSATEPGSRPVHGKKKGMYYQVGAEDPEACTPRPRTRRLRRLLTSHRAVRF